MMKSEMKMKENNMLGKNGLTMTSANHLSNIAKEMYEALQSKLEALKLYCRDYMLAINGSIYRVENESEKSELAELANGLKEIGELKSLIAYLREAIKAKMALTEDSVVEEHLQSLIKEGRTDLERPVGQKEVTFADEFAKLTPEQKGRYYALEAKCATIGMFIHPDGVFAEARKAFFEHKKNPTKVVGRGQDAELNSYTSSFTAEEVDAAFFSLQKEYRTLQAELNKLKSELEEKVAQANLSFKRDYLAKMNLAIEARKVERSNYEEAVKALKIVIPENLKGIYEKVNAVANAK